MNKESAAFPRQSGAVSSVLIALAGFTAGALVMGLVALTRHPAQIASGPVAVPLSSGAGLGATTTSRSLNRDPSWPGQADEALTWPYETATPKPERAPGVRRPDRLSGPDGWTPDPPVGP